MGATETVDLIALHEAIAAAMVSRWVDPESGPSVSAAAFYQRVERQIATPAIWLEMSSIEPADVSDDGTEQWLATLRFEAYVIMRFNTPGAKSAVRNLAALIATWIHGKGWGKSIGPARVLGVFPDAFDSPQPGDQYEVQRVEWEHDVRLGEDIWQSDGEVPSLVYLGFVPEVGPVYIDRYTLIQGTGPGPGPLPTPTDDGLLLVLE